MITMIGESYEDHLEMFRFGLEEVMEQLEQAGFDEVAGKVSGLVLSVRASKGYSPGVETRQ